MLRTVLPLALTLITAAAPAAAGPRFSTSYGTEFATIGDPGNRDSLPGEGDPPPTVFYRPVGGVDYRYRIARTEVTLGQYVEFVDAYAPRYFENSGNAVARSEFIGIGLTASPSGAAIRTGFSPDRAATMSWEYTARYVSWLHNGKVNEDWAFEPRASRTSASRSLFTISSAKCRFHAIPEASLIQPKLPASIWIRLRGAGQLHRVHTTIATELPDRLLLRCARPSHAQSADRQLGAPSEDEAVFIYPIDRANLRVFRGILDTEYARWHLAEASVHCVIFEAGDSRVAASKSLSGVAVVQEGERPALPDG